MSSSPSRIGISGQAGAAVKAAPFLRAGGCLDSGPGLPYRYDEEGEGAYPECVIRGGRRRLPRQRFSSTPKTGAAESESTVHLQPRTGRQTLWGTAVRAKLRRDGCLFGAGLTLRRGPELLSGDAGITF